MKVNDLISPFVPDEDYEGTMILFDIIVDENRNTLVKLFPHAEGVGRDEEVRKSSRDMITTWLSVTRGILASPS
jgi:hypothetical protein